MMEVEQSAQPRGFANGAAQTICMPVREGDDIIESLMITLVLMVGQILLERVAQGTFAEKNQLIETLILHGTDPPLGEGVEVGRLWRELEGFEACGLEDGIEALGEFGVTIVEQKARLGHGAVLGGQIAGDLF